MDISSVYALTARMRSEIQKRINERTHKFFCPPQDSLDNEQRLYSGGVCYGYIMVDEFLNEYCKACEEGHDLGNIELERPKINSNPTMSIYPSSAI